MQRFFNHSNRTNIINNLSYIAYTMKSLLLLSALCLAMLDTIHAFGTRGMSRLRAGYRPPVTAESDGNAAVTQHPDLYGVHKNTRFSPHVKQRIRPRRNRKSEAVRSMVRETTLSPSDFIYPLFIHDDKDRVPISSMPGCFRHGPASLVQEVQEAVGYGIKSFILFPKIADNLKSVLGEEAYNDNGLIPRTIRMLKKQFPDIVLVTDIALDPYSSVGHDGILVDGKILNDETIVQLQKQAVCHAKAGADIVAPSDMMDGRVGAIRDALDTEGYTDTSIIAYTAKYASAFYGPFRDALDSHPGSGDKKSYQQDPANGREALIEAALDQAEGADMLLVKPGLPYLDVVQRIRQSTHLPIAAYHVSGEYCMIKAAAEKGWVNERDIVMEVMTSFKRAGTDIILSYYAKDVAKWLYEKNRN